MDTSAEANETPESFEKEKKEMKQSIDELETRITSLQSTAFTLANYFFVFQGVIITIICNSSRVVLRASDRWFPLTLSILAVVLNLSALINIGRKYFQAKAEQKLFLYKYNRMEQERQKKMQQHVSPQESASDEPYRDKMKEFEPYLVLGISTIFFLAFSAIVLTGCWKFLNPEGEFGHNLPNNDKCTRLCGNTNCISICTEN